MRTFYLSLVTILVFSLFWVGSAIPVQADDKINPSAAAGRILVKFKPGISTNTIAQVNAAIEGMTVDTIRGIDVQVVEIKTGNVEAALAAYKNDPRVEYAEPDYEVKVIPVTPNDPYYYEQWGLEKIMAPAAWGVTHSVPTVKIAILDTGIDQDHEDLASKIVANANFSGTSSVDDFYGHGTWTAGIAAAITNNSLGVSGVGFNAVLMNVKVLNDYGSGTYGSVASGIIWATDNGVDVINMSLGGPNYSSTLQNAVDYAWSQGVVVIASAGNDGVNSPNYPAAYENCIAVAATSQNDEIAGFSNYGSWVDVTAPGVEIFSCLPNHGGYMGTDYGSFDGTSAAAPFVSGMAALVCSTSFGMSNAAIRAEIEETCDSINGTGTLFAHGRINAYYAVAGAGAPPPEDFTPGNHPPVMFGLPDILEEINTPITFQVVAEDEDNDPLAYSAENLPDGASFDPDTQIFAWTPTITGEYSGITLSVTDGIATSSEMITITIYELTPFSDTCKIAFTRSDNVSSSIYVMDNINSPTGQVLDNAISPSWSPDGAKIAYIANNDIYVMNTDSSGITQLTFDGLAGPTWSGSASPDWSPDGERIIFATFTPSPDGNWYKNSTQIKQINADGTGLTTLVSWTQISTYFRNPEYSPDGTKILVTAQMYMGAGGIYDAVYIMDADGTGITSITTPFAQFMNAGGWSPDGTQVVVCPETTLDGIWLVDINGGYYFQIFSGAYCFDPVWTPDGQWITFKMYNALYTIRTNGEELTQISFPGDGVGDALPDLYDPGYPPPENFPPVLRYIGDKLAAAGEPLTFTISAIDSSQDTLTYSATGLPDGATLDPVTGMFNWNVPDTTDLYTIHFEVTDGEFTDAENINIRVYYEIFEPGPTLTFIGYISWFSTADFNGDGSLDIFTVYGDYGDGASLWFGNGSGDFTHSGQTDFTDCNHAFSADMDKDGDIDLALDVWDYLEIWLNNGAGIFVKSSQIDDHFYDQCVLADLDNDGDTDIFSGNYYADIDSEYMVWLNDGTGHFATNGQITPYSILDVALGDIDNDGDLDAFISCFGSIQVWFNNGVGFFTDSGQRLGEDYSAYLITLGDVDNDGDLDGFDSAREIWLNDGSGIFSEKIQSEIAARVETLPDGSSYSGCTLEDFDLDGDLDALVSNEIFLNDGNANFTNSWHPLNIYTNAGLADIDKDGDIDILTREYIDSQYNTRIYWNVSAVPSSTVKYENYTPHDINWDIYGTRWQAQTFTPQVTHTITKIRLPLIRMGTASGNFIVSIRATDANGLPTGPDLISGYIPTSSIVASWAKTWYDFNLAGGYLLQAGVKYAIVMRAPGQDSINKCYNWVQRGGTYGGGWLCGSVNSGFTWFDESSQTWDADFEEWGIITTPPINHPPTLDPIGDKTAIEGQLLQFTLSCSDPDGDLLTCSAANLPPGSSFDANTDTFTWSDPVAGTYTGCHFEVTDGELIDFEDITITVTAAPTEPVKFSYFTTSNAIDVFYGTSWKGQTFIPQSSHTLTKVYLPLIRYGNASGDVIVSIRATDVNGRPAGPDLATGTIPCSNIAVTWSKIWYNISLGAGCEVQAGVKYAIIWRAPNMNASNPMYYWVNTTGGYADGWVVASSGGTSWFDIASRNWDANFEEWGITGHVNQPPSIEPIDDITCTVGDTITVSIQVTDPDDTLFTYEFSNVPAGMTFDGVTNTLNWQPDTAGLYQDITIKVIDDEGAFDTESFSITVNPALVMQHTLTINITGQGTVTKEPDQPTYDDGSTVILTATPTSGYIFNGWSGDLSGDTNPTTITMDADKIVTATFTQEIPPGEPSLYENYTFSNAVDIFYGISWKGQTFTPQSNHTLTKVRLPIVRRGTTASGDLVVSIRATDVNGRPTGPDLATGSIPCSNIAVTWSKIWYDISLGAGCELQAGVKYAIIWRAPNMDASNPMYYWLNTADGYEGGWAVGSSGGTSWFDLSSRNWDANFEEWGITSVTTPGFMAYPPNISTTGFSVDATIWPSNAPTEAFMVWGTDNVSFSNSTLHQNITGTGHYIFSATGLIPGTTYFYKIKIIYDSAEYSGPGTMVKTWPGMLPGKMVYSKDGQIYIMNPDGTSSVSLGAGTRPVISPDGLKIAFMVGYSGDSTIWTMNADGSNRLSLGDGADPAWSPDGTQIAFDVGYYYNSPQVWIMNADGSNRTYLVEGWSPAWSPDGTKLAFSKGAFTSGPYAGGDLCIINVDGSGLTVLTNGNSTRDADWSPDGAKIAYSRILYFSATFQAWCVQIVDTSGTMLSEYSLPILNSRCDDPAWSPDGQYIVFGGGGISTAPVYGNMYIATADFSNVSRLFNYEDGVFQYCPDWGPAEHVNNAPVLDAIGDKTITEGELLQFTISATDPDGDTLSYSASNLPSGSSFDPATRTFTWLSPVAGVYSGVHFEVTDGELTDSEDITITVNTAPTEPVKYENFTTSNAVDIFYGISWKGQTFTPQSNHTLTKVRLPIVRRGTTASGDLVVSIRATDVNGRPTGPDLATGSIPCSSIAVTWSKIWYDINLGAGCELQAGVKYAIIWRAPNMDASNPMYYWVNTTSGYADGWVVASSGGTSWFDISSRNWDANFEEWGL